PYQAVAEGELLIQQGVSANDLGLPSATKNSAGFGQLGDSPRQPQSERGDSFQRCMLSTARRR
ncbi:MAG: hypothetical protein ACKVIN_13655, partial [Longimicrobiales bacterium]